MPCRTYNKENKAVGIEDKCDCCYNFNESTNHGEEEYIQMARNERYKKWNRTERPKTPWEIKKEVAKSYQDFCHDERNKLKAAGYKGNAVKR